VKFFSYDEKTPLPDELPKELIEYLIVRDTGWSLEYIRNMPMRDYTIYSLFSQCCQRIRIIKDDMNAQMGALSSMPH